MFGNLFKSKKTTQKQLVLEESIPGNIASERPYFDYLCSWDGSLMDLENEKLTITLLNGNKIKIKLTFFEIDSPMIVHTGELDKNFKFRVITSENHFKSITFGSTKGSGFGILFNLKNKSKESVSERDNKIDFEDQYISFFKDKLLFLNQKNGRVSLQEFEELTINFACFEILCLRRKGIFNNHSETRIINDITTIAKRIIPEYNDSHISIAKMQIPMNCNWDGMWLHLQKYFRNNFNTMIQ